jgi:hypothetical protein
MRLVTTLVALGVVLIAPVAVAQSLERQPGEPPQGPLTAFGGLGGRVKIGDTIWVTDVEGRKISGKLSALDATSITLSQDASYVLPAERVRSVQLQGSVGTSALAGGAVGAAMGALLGGLIGGGECEFMCFSRGHAAAGGALLAGAIGLGLGAAVPGRQEVYRAPEVAMSSRYTAPRAKAFVLSVSF